MHPTLASYHPGKKSNNKWVIESILLLFFKIFTSQSNTHTWLIIHCISYMYTKNNWNIFLIDVCIHIEIVDYKLAYQIYVPVLGCLYQCLRTQTKNHANECNIYMYLYFCTQYVIHVLYLRWTDNMALIFWPIHT